MFQSSRGRIRDQVESLRRQFAQAPGLPFGDLLSTEKVERVLLAEQIRRCARRSAACWRNGSPRGIRVCPQVRELSARREVVCRKAYCQS